MWCAKGDDRGGQIGARIRVCGKCFNDWAETVRTAKLVKGMEMRCVQMDQEMEADGRVVALRERLAAEKQLHTRNLREGGRLYEYVMHTGNVTQFSAWKAAVEAQEHE